MTISNDTASTICSGLYILLAVVYFAAVWQYIESSSIEVTMALCLGGIFAIHCVVKFSMKAVLPTLFRIDDGY